MNLTGGHTEGFSSAAAQTELDAVLFDEFEREEQPDYLSSRNGTFFNQITRDRKSFIWQEWSNVGAFEVHQEQEDIKRTDVRTANKTTVDLRKYIKSVPVSTEMREDDVHNTDSVLVRNLGDRMRLTQDSEAVLRTYGDGFDGNVHTAPDGNSLYNNSHTTISGDTVDNLETGTLTPDNLDTLVQSLQTQLGHDGELGSFVFAGILVPPALYKTAKEVMDSELLANSAENNTNIFSTVYGTVAIKMSTFLDSDFNSATNADTSYYVVSRNHQITRATHTTGVSTDLIEPRYSNTDSWEYRARYREESFPGSFLGTAASNGSA